MAASVGYTVQTFNSTTLGTTSGTWQPWNFYGNSTPADRYKQNADGTISLQKGSNCGASIATAAHKQNTLAWDGIAFGGGGYFEVTMSITGADVYSYPNCGVSFFMLDVEHTSQGPYPINWPGTEPAWNPKKKYSAYEVAAYKGQLWASAINKNVGNVPPSPGKQSSPTWITYTDFFEIDVMEFDAASPRNPTAYQNGIGNWYSAGPGPTATGNPHTEIGGCTGCVIAPARTDFSKPHRYGLLWVPATGSGNTTMTQGYLKFYFDGTQTGKTFYWNYYDFLNPATYPAPPPVNGSTAMSGMDWKHMMLILGGDVQQQATVHSAQVWQASGASNLVN
ncbi:MAG: hypothetical protein ABIQ86_10760 [Steroidobacteraceae bacterium]